MVYLKKYIIFFCDFIGAMPTKKNFQNPIDNLGNWVYYRTIESEQPKERSGLQCLKRILMLQNTVVVECVSPGHIRMAGCIRMLFAAPETDISLGMSQRHLPGSDCKPRHFLCLDSLNQ